MENKPEKQSQTVGQTQKLNPFSFAFLRALRKSYESESEEQWKGSAIKSK